MRALLWKEYREKRIWLALLTVSTVVVVLGDVGYTFLGAGGVSDRLSVLSGWTYLSLVAALLLGAGSFAGELDKAAEFLMTRPVSWKKLLAAKALVGIGIIALTALITALVFRITVPAQYAHLATLSEVAAGAGMAVLVMGLGYCVGLMCSTALPGLAGGLLVLLLVYVLMAAEALIWQAVHHGRATPPPWSILVGWPLGTMAAFVVNARFGLTLPVGRRLARYVYLPAAAGLLLLSLDIAGVRPYDLSTVWRAGHSRQVLSVGPDARYALGSFPDGRVHLFDLSGDRPRNWRTPMAAGPSPIQHAQQGFGWANADAVYGLNLTYAHRIAGMNTIAIYSPGGRGRATQRTVGALSDQRQAILIPSPSGERVLAAPVAYVTVSNPWFGAELSKVRMVPTASGYTALPVHGDQEICVVDIPSARVIMRRRLDASNYWWQSEDEIGYLDRQGSRRVLSLRQ